MSRLAPLLLVGLAGISAAACLNLGAKPDPTRFYTLTPEAPPERDTSGSGSHSDRVTLGVGPITLPGYLDRDQLVTRIAPNRFAVAENDRWGEPLEENVLRVLSQNLSRLLRGYEVARFPWPRADKPAYQVAVEVLRFEADTNREARLVARWVLSDLASSAALVVQESRWERPAEGRSAEYAVAALSRLLSDFSSEIAGAVRATTQGP